LTGEPEKKKKKKKMGGSLQGREKFIVQTGGEEWFEGCIL